MSRYCPYCAWRTPARGDAAEAAYEQHLKDAHIETVDEDA